MNEDAGQAGARWRGGARSGGVGGAGPAGANPHAREWAEGWDRFRSCPRDPKADPTPGARGYWRTPRGVGPSAEAQAAHDRRRQIVRILRRAGYEARKWPVGPIGADGWQRYEGGPAEGRRAVDPWELARDLHRCEANWAANLAIGKRGARVVPVPIACHRLHLCPVCAGRRSAALADALRARIAGIERPDSWSGRALITLTQRADPAETLAQASERLRRAVRRLEKTEQWKTAVLGSFIGYEVTYREGRGWHAHAHVVIVSQRERMATIRGDIGRMWREITDKVKPGYGWEPAAGGCGIWPAKPRKAGLKVKELRALCAGWMPRANFAKRADLEQAIAERDARWPRVRSWDGPWFRVLDTDREVFQACKYPSPAICLSAVALAEFVAFAHGRRFHEGSGELRGIMKDAKQIEQSTEEGAEEGEQIVSLCGPHAPALDAIAPGLGIPEDHDEPTPPEGPRWRLRASTVAIVEECRGLMLAVEVEPGRYMSPLGWAAEVAEARAAVVIPADEKPREVREDTNPPLNGALYWVAFPVGSWARAQLIVDHAKGAGVAHKKAPAWARQPRPIQT